MARHCWRGKSSRIPTCSRTAGRATWHGIAAPRTITSSRTNAIRASRSTISRRTDRCRATRASPLRFAADLGPGIFQRDRSIEDGLARGRVGINAEVPLTLELKARAMTGGRQCGLDLGVAQDLEGVRIDIGQRIASAFSRIG